MTLVLRCIMSYLYLSRCTIQYSCVSVAVVVAFFICWAPFHCQRLLAVYGKSTEQPSKALVVIYTALTYVSGVLYFLSTTVNPLLYHTMSNKFRQAFKVISNLKVTNYYIKTVWVCITCSFSYI